MRRKHGNIYKEFCRNLLKAVLPCGRSQDLTKKERPT